MEKELLQPLSGFRDYDRPTKSWVTSQLRQTFEQYGYQPLETPALERQELLLGKLGEEGQKQLYLFEDNGKRPVGLRYDLTVPLARYVAANLGSLTLPYKRYEIGPSWRAEKPQKGRYRQFIQADVDIIGAPEPSSELELFSVATMAAEKLGLVLTCQLNDRRIVNEIFNRLKVQENQQTKVMQLLDKRDKMSEDKFADLFQEIGLSEVQRRQVQSYFTNSGTEALEQIEELIGENDTLNNIKTMLDWGKSRSFAIEFTPSMVRGLDYYTGTIFEFKAADYDGGTVAAGGRYDSLIKNLTGQRVTAVGLSFGVDRLGDLLEGKEPASTLFIARLPEITNDLNSWVKSLRQQGKNVEVYLDETVELGKQIKYADKRGYQKILIPLKEEWSKGNIIVKDLISGNQESVKREKIDE